MTLGTSTLGSRAVQCLPPEKQDHSAAAWWKTLVSYWYSKPQHTGPGVLRTGRELAFSDLIDLIDQHDPALQIQSPEDLTTPSLIPHAKRNSSGPRTWTQFSLNWEIPSNSPPPPLFVFALETENFDVELRECLFSNIVQAR